MEKLVKIYKFLGKKQLMIKTHNEKNLNSVMILKEIK